MDGSGEPSKEAIDKSGGDGGLDQGGGRWVMGSGGNWNIFFLNIFLKVQATESIDKLVMRCERK